LAIYIEGQKREWQKKSIQVETDVKKTTRETKEQMENDVRNDMKILKIKNWTNCIQDRNNWKLYVEKAKTFKD
jgi:hypothetical protein